MITRQYIYNKVRGKVAATLLLPLSSLLFAGCSDFLDVLPLDQVVLEKFWTEKADVTSVVNSCYAGLEDGDVMTRMMVWGELRSDNLKAGSNVSNDLNELLKENLLQTNPMCNWSKFYEVINRCNTVIHYSPEVQALDPNYSESDMKANIAEAVAIRSLCYFYLIRAFRDVPFTTEPSINDGQNYVIPATPFNVVLDSLITDLESVKNDAPRRYYPDDSPNAFQNSAYITRWAIYTLLADLYLWKGDWDNAIKYCDLVLDFKRRQYDEMLEREGTINDIELIGGIPMILEKPLSSSTQGHAYNEIFGLGHSFESIFELNFQNDQNPENSLVSTYYGSSNNSRGRLSAPDFLMLDVATGQNTVFKKKDCRAYEAAEEDNSTFYIRKYVRRSVDFTTQSVNKWSDLKLAPSNRSGADANWIIYRLSDVILIKAEALIERSAADYPAAFNLINIVNKRALSYSSAMASTVANDTLKAEDYPSKTNLEDLLLEERQREFLFEGKRWFDLVRVARRDSTTSRLSSLVSRKYKQDANVIKIKLADLNYIYFPYAKSELKVNPLLKQNPAFNKGEDSELTK